MVYVIPLLLIFLALLQVTVIPPLPLLGISLDLVLLIVLSWTMVRGVQEAAIGAFVGGLTLDILSTYPLGSHALILLLLILPLGWLKAPAYRGNLAFPIAGAFLATVLYKVLLLTLSQILGQGTDWGATLWRIVLPLAMVEATLIPLVYWIIDRVDRRLQRRRQSI